MIQTLPFGRTGHLSTRVLFGGAALSRATQAETDKAMETIMKYGVNHIDTSASYGESEVRLGPWMKKYRGQFFLATKPTVEHTRRLKTLSRNRLSICKLITWICFSFIV